MLFERTTELKEIGAGIAIAANAMKVLDSLGLADAVRHRGAEPLFYEVRSWRGGCSRGCRLRGDARCWGPEASRRTGRTCKRYCSMGSRRRG
jgi:2-polyprenyl-6-methoxyphenol hydroxylase-like FAD-dependent oxidoreductase